MSTAQFTQPAHPVGFVNSVVLVCRGILLTPEQAQLVTLCGQANASRPRPDQATSSAGGLIAVNGDSAALPERGRSTPATPAEGHRRCFGRPGLRGTVCLQNPA